MAVQDDVVTVRGAVQTLAQAVERVTCHYGDTVDVRRLKADVSRLADDIDLLCGPAVPEQASDPVRPTREIIADTAYSYDFWSDAEDEGLGGPDRRCP